MTQPDIGRPEKSNGRTPRLATAASKRSGPTRATRSFLMTPTNILPFRRKALPPNIDFSDTPSVPVSTARSRTASVSSNGIRRDSGPAGARCQAEVSKGEADDPDDDPDTQPEFLAAHEATFDHPRALQHPDQAYQDQKRAGDHVGQANAHLWNLHPSESSSPNLLIRKPRVAGGYSRPVAPSDRIPELPASERPGGTSVVLEQPPRHNHPVYLIGTVVHAASSRVPIHALERSVRREAEGAVYLDGSIDHVMQHLSPVELDQADLHPGFAATVHDPRSVERHQPAGLDLGRGFRHIALDLPLLSEERAVGVTAVGPVTHELECALSLAQPAHAVEDPAGAEALLRYHESLTARTEQIVTWHPHIAEPHLAVRAVLPAHHRDDSDDLVAGSVSRHDDRGELQVAGRFRVGLAKDGCEGGPIGAAGEPLVAVDDPLVTLQPAGRLHQGGV